MSVKRAQTSRGGSGERGRGEEEGGGEEGGAKCRTQLANMGKIVANEDGQSSRDLVRWRGGGIMTLTLHQGSRGEKRGTEQELLCDNTCFRLKD